MEQKTIDYKVNEMLSQMMELQKKLQIANDNNIIQKSEKKKKRKEGSYELYNNGKARLYYMHNQVKYRTTVDAEDEEKAEAQLALFVEKVKKGTFISTNYTFTEFAQIWLDQKVRPNAGERCVKKYIGALNNRILPELGNYKLKDLTKQILERFFNQIKQTETNYEKRTTNNIVKPSSVLKWKSIIHACLNYAVECELLIKNPCDNIKINFTTTQNEEQLIALVKNKKEKVCYYDLSTYKFVCNKLENEFMEYYKDDTITADKKLLEVARRFILLLALKTGMRRSEIFGLARNETYNDLDLENATFEVNKSRHYLAGKGKFTKYPKNDTSIRKKSLPKSILSYLKLYYELLDKIGYTDTYIFDFISIDGICSFFQKWQEKNNINKIRFHDLRHTHATILLFSGVDVKTISERLGHADIQTTLNIYADVLKELDKKAADALDTI